MKEGEWMHVHIYMRVFVYVCMHRIYIYVCVYVYVCVYMYAFVTPSMNIIDLFKIKEEYIHLYATLLLSPPLPSYPHVSM